MRLLPWRRDARLLTRVLGELELTRPELEHILACERGCCLTGDIEPGISTCRDFDRKFRGYVPRESASVLNPALVALYEPMIRQALQSGLIYGRPDVHG